MRAKNFPRKYLGFTFKANPTKTKPDGFKIYGASNQPIHRDVFVKMSAAKEWCRRNGEKLIP